MEEEEETGKEKERADAHSVQKGLGGRRGAPQRMIFQRRFLQRMILEGFRIGLRKTKSIIV